MKILVFTPTIQSSAIGRMAALVLRSLTASGHEVSVIRTEKEHFSGSAIHDFACRPVSWTDRPAVIALAESADACIYQVGDNEEFHCGCLEWMPQFPGIVSLHDIFLGHLFLGWAEGRRQEAADVVRCWYGEAAEDALFQAATKVNFIEQTRGVSPMTEWICAMARGVILHSGFGTGRVLASCPGPVYQVPLPYECPPLPAGRPEARPAGEDRFRVLTVGHVNPNKRAESVIRAIGSSKYLRARTVYRLVGKITPARRGHLTDLAEASGVMLEISGEVDDTNLACALVDADVICCMRWPSLEGSSASTIEAMLSGKPAIVTNTGFYSELPDGCVEKIDPENEMASCRAALERLHGNEGERRRIGEAARSWAEQIFTPANYAENLVRMAHATNHLRPIFGTLEKISGTLKRWGAPVEFLTLEETLAPLNILTGTSISVNDNSPPTVLINNGADFQNGPRPGPGNVASAGNFTAGTALRQPGQLSTGNHLLVDICQLYKMEYTTGVQRVTRCILNEWLDQPPEGWSPQPVVFDENGVWACDGPTVRQAFPALQNHFHAEDVIIAAGDRFVFLHLNLHLPDHMDWLLDAKARGARLTFVVYDVLPVLSPHWFPDDVGPLYSRWIKMVAELGDDIACISRSVQEEFLSWFRKEYRDRTPPRVRHFPLGSDPFPACELLSPAIAEAMQSRPTALMVSTVEPRKGHAQALSALEILWASGHELNLAIAGREGWKVNALAARIREHPEFGRRLFWLEKCSDGQLASCYRDSGVLLAPSFGEGFGLSVVEAARWGRAVIARDLPVFREVAPPGTTFFSGHAPGHLADAILSWLHGPPEPAPATKPAGWSESACALFDLESQ